MHHNISMEKATPTHKKGQIKDIQPWDNQPNKEENKGNEKMKKDIGTWC